MRQRCQLTDDRLLRRSFVEFVPSRYGSSECLTAATNCVLAKVKSLLAPQKLKDPEIVLRLYSKALQTLQDAISDKSSYLDADVLCATQLLSLYEVFQALPLSDLVQS